MLMFQFILCFHVYLIVLRLISFHPKEPYFVTKNFIMSNYHPKQRNKFQIDDQAHFGLYLIVSISILYISHQSGPIKISQ